jgi:hypothetical protein
VLVDELFKAIAWTVYHIPALVLVGREVATVEPTQGIYIAS